MLVVLSGVAMAFNILIILHKLRKLMIMNAIVDLFTLGLIVVLTTGSFSGMTTGMIASALISLYLLKFPLKEPTIKDVVSFIFKSNKRSKK